MMKFKSIWKPERSEGDSSWADLIVKVLLQNGEKIAK